MFIRLVSTTFIALLVATLWSGIAAADPKHRVVYHVSDVDKIEFALRNVDNHISGVGGPENAEIVLVVIGKAMTGFLSESATDFVKEAIPRLKAQGVEFDACGNTMRKMKLELDQLVPGFERRDEGGVVRVADLQMQGFVYLRP